MIYRTGGKSDLEQLKQLALQSWKRFETVLTKENWERLLGNLNNNNTYLELLEKGHCIVCESATKEIIGMAFLVPHGNPTEIYKAEWSSLRFVTVHSGHGGKGIGRQLIEKCIEIAKENKEKTIVLHTSEFMDNARHLYESLGFTIIREIEPRYGKKYWLYKLETGAIEPADSSNLN